MVMAAVTLPLLLLSKDLAVCLMTRRGFLERVLLRQPGVGIMNGSYSLLQPVCDRAEAGQ